MTTVEPAVCFFKIRENGTSSKEKMRLQSPPGCAMKESSVLGDTSSRLLKNPVSWALLL
jgi:hypothetical protein